MMRLLFLFLFFCFSHVAYTQKVTKKYPFENKNLKVVIQDTTTEGYIDTLLISYEMRYFRFLAGIQYYYGFIDNKSCIIKSSIEHFWYNHMSDNIAIENDYGRLEYMPEGKIVFRKYIGSEKLKKINYFFLVIIDREYRYHIPMYWNDCEQLPDRYCKD